VITPKEQLYYLQGKPNVKADILLIMCFY